MRGNACQVAALCVLILLPAGCVERTLTISSQPTGALVYVSSVEVGRTPLDMPFTWYGDYEIVLRRQGYRTLKTHWNVKPPIYDVSPLDLLSEMAPWTYHVRRSAHFALSKATEPADADLIKRHDELRQRSLEPLEK